MMACFINILRRSSIPLDLPIFVTYPQYFSEQAQRKLQHALEIAEIQTFRLVEEDTALINAYLYQNQNAISQYWTSETIAFLDIGHSKTTITVANFASNKTTKYFSHSDKDLGGRDLDYELL